MLKYIENRIKENPYNSDILQCSTPVICFGDINKSEIATLGINPSDKEFVDNKGNFLLNSSLRFQNCYSLKQTDLTLLNTKQTDLVFDYCCNYFKNPNPYKKWFDVIENYILSFLNVSYYDNTCCHIDLIQWATKDKWRDLSQISKNNLLDNDFSFFIKLLKFQKIKILLINGIGIFNILNKKLSLRIIKDEYIYSDNKKCRVIKFSFISNNKNIICFAWSQNLQSSFGLTNKMKTKIGQWLRSNQLNN